MKGTVKSVSVRMKDGVQRSWTGDNGTLYYFNVTIQGENGTMVTGEAGGKTPGTYRFAEGDEVEFTYTEGQYGNKLKIDRPKDGSGGGTTSRSTAAGAPYQAKPSGGWTPEKENSVMIQGLLKSIIESGMTSDHWAAALKKALTVHDEALAERVPKPVDAAAPITTPTGLKYHPQGHPDGPKIHQPVATVPGGPGIVEDDQAAPF